MEIQKDISIEELVEKIPGSVKYLMNEGIKCIACGEPIWGTLEEAAKDKGFKDDDIEKFIKDLTKMYEDTENIPKNTKQEGISFNNMNTG